MSRRCAGPIAPGAAGHAGFGYRFVTCGAAATGVAWIARVGNPNRALEYDEDLSFFPEVAKTLARLAAKPVLSQEEAKAIRRAVAALEKLPELTPEINVRIEVAYRVGDEGFGESSICTIDPDPAQIEIGSGGSQYDPAVGSDSYGLESFLCYATLPPVSALRAEPSGGAERKGDRDTWRELEYFRDFLARPHSITGVI